MSVPNKISPNHLSRKAMVYVQPLFPTRRGDPLSRDGLQRRLTIYSSTAANACPSLRSKHISPHVLRHSAAMRLLAAGVDTTVIALWLGHEHVATTQI
jgi:site-specific recombinase XerD